MPSATCALLSGSLKLAHTPRSQRIVDLLRSRNALSEVELANFRDVEQSGPRIIQAIDQQIARRVEEVLEILYAARKQAENNLADAKSLLHPIHSLPCEILHEIFTYYVPA